MYLFPIPPPPDDPLTSGRFQQFIYALDHLSYPVMITQGELVFSAARRTLTPERKALRLKVLEACECLRWW
jgi:hypothetical protein